MLTPLPTRFSDLNAVLDVLVEGLKRRLADKLVGVYLQGSFAVGDADAQSDCDFVVVVERDLDDAARDSLDALHGAIHALPYLPWRHRLEGSYVPRAILRRWSLTPRDPQGEAPRPADWADPGTSGSPPRVYPFLYLDHGAKHLVRSEHDNTQVVRWSLREQGIVLCGPDPKTLIDPVEPAALRSEVRAVMARVAAARLEPLDRVYWMAFWVGLYCRMLHTLETGTLVSKKAACRWAAATLDASWRPLIERASAVRDADRGLAMAPVTAADVAATQAFARYATTRAAQL